MIRVPADQLPREPYVKMARDHQPGDVAVYTTDHAPGAFANDSRVRKTVFGPGDQHPVGSLATVLGSVGPFDAGRGREFGYFVIWDAMPGVPVFVRGGKLELDK